MVKPRKTIRPIKRHISIPEDLYAEIELRLFSPILGQVPFGAWSEYFERLARADMARWKEVRPLTVGPPLPTPGGIAEQCDEDD